MADRKWKKAMVVYQGGMSYSIAGKVFKKNRALPVNDYELAMELEGINGFSVSHEYHETSPKPDVDFGEEPDNVEKAKKTLRKGKKKVARKKRKTTE